MLASVKSLPNLDLLRSVAVLLVAASHVLLYTGYGDRAAWSGITGVCIFFVHTSLVLMWSLERDAHVGRFYVRRAFRIYPLWLVILAATLLFRIPTSPVFAPAFGFFKPDFKELAENALLLFNLGRGCRVVGASWSLPIEVQMYLVLPILFAFARTSSARVWPLLVVDAFIMLFDKTQYAALNAQLPFCIPYFLPGIMAYILYKRPRATRLPGWSFPVWLALLIAVAHTYGTFRASWLLCLALGLSLPFFHDITSVPVRRVAGTLARYSYGIYLTHFIGIAIAVHLLRGHSVLLRGAVFLLVVGGLSYALYHLVEEPMIRAGARLARRIEPGPSPKINEAALDLEPAP